MLKCSTLPSSRNMLTSSTPGMGCTLSFLSAPWSFLSSCAAAGLVFLTIFRRTVPFPPVHAQRIRGQSWGGGAHGQEAVGGLTDPVGRSSSLQLSQFRGVHRIVCFSRGSGAGREDDAAGFIEFWMVGRRALVDGQELRFRRKHNQIQRDTRGAADHILSASSCFTCNQKTN